MTLPAVRLDHALICGAEQVKGEEPGSLHSAFQPRTAKLGHFPGFGVCCSYLGDNAVSQAVSKARGFLGEVGGDPGIHQESYMCHLITPDAFVAATCSHNSFR